VRGRRVDPPADRQALVGGRLDGEPAVAEILGAVEGHPEAGRDEGDRLRADLGDGAALLGDGEVRAVDLVAQGGGVDRAQLASGKSS
jgi:hypothetical protein